MKVYDRSFMNRNISAWVIVLLLLCVRSFAQPHDYGKVWVQGQSITYTTTFTSSARPINQIADSGNLLYFSHGNSNICDSDGNLALLCDGYNLYNSSRNLIEGGDTIVPKELFINQGGFSRYPQNSIILPFSNGRYGVVTPSASDSEFLNYWNNPQNGRALYDLLLYHEVDMTANGGQGKVTKRMVPLIQHAKLSKTQMMACRHGDGKSLQAIIWVLLSLAF